jgi:DNA-binding LacI/PurR family transcriptional regulator
MPVATRRLISLGHKRIAFVSEPPHNALGFVADARREQGFRATMAYAGLKVHRRRRCDTFLHPAAREMATEQP